MLDKNKINIQDDPIYQYLNPHNNDELSNLSQYDLTDFLMLLKDYKLVLRKKLGLSDNVTFGFEIEFEGAKLDEVALEFASKNLDKEWALMEDLSLDDGGEAISPVLVDHVNTWKNLAKVCNLIKQYGEIGDSSAGHIHIGTHILGTKKEDWLHFLRLWSVYENIIYRFGYGEYLNERFTVNDYAIPLSPLLIKDLNILRNNRIKLDNLLYTLTYTRNRAVNFQNVNLYTGDTFNLFNTLEFRHPNGSLNPIIWQNNLYFLVKLIMYAKGSSYDEDKIINRYLKNRKTPIDLDFYEKILLEQATELADMLFDNNLDKLYFLRQYVKSFSTTRSMRLIKSKDFTK